MFHCRIVAPSFLLAFLQFSLRVSSHQHAPAPVRVQSAPKIVKWFLTINASNEFVLTWSSYSSSSSNPPPDIFYELKEIKFFMKKIWSNCRILLEFLSFSAVFINFCVVNSKQPALAGTTRICAWHPFQSSHVLKILCKMFLDALFSWNCLLKTIDNISGKRERNPHLNAALFSTRQFSFQKSKTSFN